ncbi:MAG: TetR/AcrR family transcriptional regulator, partial [bacterium]|nr:TetR/AcrR family transcriptional regulator [bacterium]
TKSRIIKTAVRLFNEQGTRAISTRHIARELGMSPGNLYYHFRNKEDIIRAILEEMIQEMDNVWENERLPSLKAFRQMLNDALSLLWNYRFFQHELVALLQRDPELKKRYRAIRTQRWDEIGSFFRGLIQAGIINEPDDPATLTALIKMFWLIGDYWLSFLDIEGVAIDPDTLQEGTDLYLHILRPYLSQETLDELTRLGELFYTIKE